MRTVYTQTENYTSLIRYHLVFATRYRRKVFRVKGTKPFFRKLTIEACEEIGVEVLMMQISADHVYMHVSAPPTLSPQDILFRIKKATNHPMRKQFPDLSKIPSIWTRHYFVTSNHTFGEHVIDDYLESLPKVPQAKKYP